MEKKWCEKESYQVEIRTFSIIVKSRDLVNKLKDILFTYNSFENTLLSLVIQSYSLYKEGKVVNDYNLLTSPKVMVDVLYNYKSEYSVQIKYLRKKYKKNKLWIALRETTNKLNPHNLIYVIKEVKVNFDIHFKNLEDYNQEPNLFDGFYAVELDKHNSLSFARVEKENLVGIRLSNGFVYVNVDKEERENIMDIDKLHSVKVVYDNGNLRLQIIYLKKVIKIENKQTKYASIGIGINNLMVIFVDDETTPSLLVDGKPFKKYNEKFDKIIAKINENKSKEVAKMIILEKYKFIEEQFSKITKYVMEYLNVHGVTDLFVSKNSAKLKNIQILIMELLENIENQAQEYGITINYSEVDAEKNLEWLKDKKSKLCYPIKIKSNEELYDLVGSLQNVIEE